MAIQGRHHHAAAPDHTSLADLLSLFHGLTGFRAVARSAAGAPLGTEDPGPRFCRLLRDARPGREECHQCLAALAPAPGDPRPAITTCPLGLMVGIVRLPAPQGDAALVTCGQVLPSDLDAEGRADLVRQGAALGADPVALRAALRELRPVPRAEFRAALDLLQSLLRWRLGPHDEHEGEDAPPAVAALAEALRAGDLVAARDRLDAAAEAIAEGLAGVRGRLRARRLLAGVCEAAAEGAGSAERAEAAAARCCHEMEGHEGDAAASVRRALLALLGEAAGEGPSGAVARAVAYVERHYAHDLTLEEVARHAGLSPAYLSARFKREVGVGFKRFLLRVRLDEARRLLANPDCRVEDVANAVGFGDAHYFSRVFSRSYGVPPGRFRNRWGSSPR